jgi:hypothetical protein
MDKVTNEGLCDHCKADNCAKCIAQKNFCGFVAEKDLLENFIKIQKDFEEYRKMLAPSENAAAMLADRNNKPARYILVTRSTDSWDFIITDRQYTVIDKGIYADPKETCDNVLRYIVQDVGDDSYISDNGNVDTDNVTIMDYDELLMAYNEANYL